MQHQLAVHLPVSGLVEIVLDYDFSYRVGDLVMAKDAPSMCYAARIINIERKTEIAEVYYLGWRKPNHNRFIPCPDMRPLCIVCESKCRWLCGHCADRKGWAYQSESMKFDRKCIDCKFGPIPMDVLRHAYGTMICEYRHRFVEENLSASRCTAACARRHFFSSAVTILSNRKDP